MSGVKQEDNPSTSCDERRLQNPGCPVFIDVSSRALFNMVAESKLFDDEGLKSDVEINMENENALDPVAVFQFVKALMHVNERLKELYPESKELFDVVLMTNNPAQVGVRLIKSLNHHGLRIEKFCMTCNLTSYLKAYKTHLYLSTDPEKVKKAIDQGIAAATVFTPKPDVTMPELSDTQLRVAFDGDAVVFSDESEIFTKKQGLEAFFKNEKENEDTPLSKGPLACFLEALVYFQQKLRAKKGTVHCPIRTFLVTSRSAASSGARALKTLRSLGLEIDAVFFLSGADKGPVLQAIKPHIFFDDQMKHIDGAIKHGVVSGHVPYGISQKYEGVNLIKPPANDEK